MRKLLWLLVLAPSLAFGLTPENIPAPGPNNWVIDLSGKIPAADIQQANAAAQSASDRKLGEVAVLIVDSTGGQDPRRFAEQVHYQWNIGTGRGDGVLFFVALSDRAAETLLPFGVKTYADQQRSDTAMSQVIVPAFKRGAPGDAIREGTRALVRLLEDSPLNNPDANANSLMNAPPTDAPVRAVRPPSELAEPARGSFSVDAANALSPGARASLDAALNGLYADGHGKLYVYTVRASDFAANVGEIANLLRKRLHPSNTPGVQVAVLSTDSSSAAIAGDSLKPAANGWAISELLNETQREMQQGLSSPDEAVVRFVQRYDALVTYGPRLSNYTSHASSQISAGIRRNATGFALGAATLVGGGLFGLMKWLRFRKRRCKVCGDHRQRLDEQGDDSYLSEGQKHEENLKSVDYDVWWCARCSDALVLRYRAFLTSYKTCPACDFVCAMQSTKTLIHATYTSGGQVEVTLRCNRCSHHQTHMRYTPRITRSSSSSSSSFGSSRSSGGGSSFGGSSGRW